MADEKIWYVRLEDEILPGDVFGPFNEPTAANRKKRGFGFFGGK